MQINRNRYVVNAPNCPDCGKFFNIDDGCGACGIPKFKQKTNSKLPISKQRGIFGVLVTAKTSDGVQIKDIGVHAYDRMADRGYGASHIKNVLEKGGVYEGHTDDTTVYEKNGTFVVVNHEIGKLVTIIRDNDDRRYERR